MKLNSNTQQDYSSIDQHGIQLAMVECNKTNLNPISSLTSLAGSTSGELHLPPSVQKFQSTNLAKHVHDRRLRETTSGEGNPSQYECGCEKRFDISIAL